MKFKINKEALLTEGAFMDMVAKSGSGALSIGNLDNRPQFDKLKKMVSSRIQQNKMLNNQHKDDNDHNYKIAANNDHIDHHIN